MNNQRYSILLLIAFCCFASCQLDSTTKTFRNELTQSQLQSGDREALLWGQSRDRFKKCTVENQYYDIIEGGWTMTKYFNNLLTESHDGLIVTFSYIFVNFDASYINQYTNMKSNIKFDDANARYFRAQIANGNQGCGYSGNDGRGTITAYIPHTSSSLKVFIDAQLTGNQKLGIRDLTIQTVKCIGNDYYFNILLGKCYCQGNFNQQTVNNNKVCVKK